MPKQIIEPIKRFNKLISLAESGCWEWQGALSRGYGQFMISKKEGTVGAHRASWRLYFGDIPTGMFVCHKCDNRKCVNPLHLFIGDQKMNLQDASAKGRLIGNRTRGENHKIGKLKKEDVENIRTSYCRNTRGYGFLAKEYNVSKHMIYRIIKGLNWKIAASPLSRS